MIKWKGGRRGKSQQPGGGGDLLAYKQETRERKQRVRMSNSQGVGGDLSANTTIRPKSYE